MRVSFGAYFYCEWLLAVILPLVGEGSNGGIEGVKMHTLERYLLLFVLVKA